MKHKSHLIGLIGVGCTSLCLLGVPFLVSLLSAVGLHSFLSERVMNLMLAMFIFMYGAGSYSAFRQHRRPGPGVLALSGTGLLIGLAAMSLPPAAGWLALALFTGAWLWDVQLLKACHAGESR